MLPMTATVGSGLRNRRADRVLDAAPQRGFRSDIEGLRAVAVLAVMLFHAGVPGIKGGFVGVDVFFVISGFLITGILCREAAGTGTFWLARFYGARARRLLPAAGIVLVATAVFAAVLLPPLQARQVLGDGIASALYAGNYRLALHGTDYLAADAPPSPFQHFWSLGVEEQFYLVWPALIIATAWLVRRRRTASASPLPYLIVLAVVAALSFAISLIWTGGLRPWAFFSLPARAWELAAGGMVALSAVVWSRLPKSVAVAAGWVGLILIGVACTRLSGTTPYPGSAALVPVLGASLVIVSGCVEHDSESVASWPCPRCGRSAQCPTPGTSGTGRCWCWHRRCSATRSGWSAHWARSPWPADSPCSPSGWSRIRSASPSGCEVRPH